jgi:hypothetical protein
VRDVIWRIEVHAVPAPVLCQHRVALSAGRRHLRGESQIHHDTSGTWLRGESFGLRKPRAHVLQARVCQLRVPVCVGLG